jgi:hypothetical protein
LSFWMSWSSGSEFDLSSYIVFIRSSRNGDLGVGWALTLGVCSTSSLSLISWFCSFWSCCYICGVTKKNIDFSVGETKFLFDLFLVFLMKTSRVRGSGWSLLGSGVIFFRLLMEIYPSSWDSDDEEEEDLNEY